MAVMVKSEANPKATVDRNTLSAPSYNVLLLVIVARNLTQKNGCATAPVPKSVMARLKIRIFEGVRKDGVFTKVKIIKTFKTVAKTAVKPLIAIMDTKKSVSTIVVLSLFVFTTACIIFSDTHFSFPPLIKLYTRMILVCNSWLL